MLWKEYAASIGVGVQSLTQAQKIEAEYQGVMRETAAQQGNLKTLSEGLAGAQAEAANQGRLAYTALGDAMTPLIETGTKLGTTLLSGLTDAAEACPPLTAGLTTATAAMMGLTAAATALATAKTLLSKVGVVAGTVSTLGKVALVLGGLAAIYTGIKKAAEQAAEAEQARVQANREAAESIARDQATLSALGDRYNELSGYISLSFAQQQEMARIQSRLQNEFGITASSVKGLAGEYNGLGEAIAAAQEEQKAQSAEALEQVADDAWTAYETLTSMYNKRDDSLKTISYRAPTIETVKAEADLETVNQALRESPLLLNAFAATLAAFSASAKEAGTAVNDDLITALSALVNMDASLVDGIDGGRIYGRVIADEIFSLASDPAITDAITQMRKIYAQALQGLTPTEKEINAFAQGWQTIAAEDSPLMTLLTDFAARSEDVNDSADSLLMGLLALGDGFVMLGENGAAFTGSTKDIAYTLTGTAEDAAKATMTLDELKDSLANVEKQSKALNVRLQQNAPVRAAVKQWRELCAQFTDAKRKGGDTNTVLRKMTDVCKSAKVGFNGMEDGIGDATKAFDAYDAAMQADATSMQATFSELQNELYTLQMASVIMGSAGMDTSAIEAAIANVMRLLEELAAKAAADGVTLVPTGESSGGGGGGGGGKKDDAEEAARAAEEARKQAIQDDYDLLDHRRHMNEITLEEYISMLRKMRSEHEMAADEIMELEEKIYDAEQELLARRTEQVDRLASGVVTAIENRYQKMLDAETERLDQSRDAWQAWADDTTAAIQAQIDALDELSTTEDREAKDAEELRKIAKLKQEIEFEQDEYNRAKLSQQLEQAIASREERLRKLEISNQKDALQQQIDAAQAEADVRISALDEEQTALEKQYAARMEQAALEAEAERLLMSATQQDILSLIADYAPEYSATGESLGERLAGGFIAGVSNIESWFASFNEKIEAMQASIAQTALAAADQLYAKQPANSGPAASSVVVNQTTNINQPVETPGEFARRMREIDEELATQILRNQ